MIILFQIAIGLSLDAMILSIDLSSRWKLLCYLIDPVGIERDMPLDLHNSRERILVRPHRIDRLRSSSRNAVVIAIAFIGTVGCIIRTFQLGKINILTWNVLNGRIRRFAERQGVAGIRNHMAGDGYDHASGIALDGNGMIWIWKLHLLFFHVFGLRLSALAQAFRNCVTCCTNSSGY